MLLKCLDVCMFMLYFLVLGFMYNLRSRCLMKCLNEFFIDCLISYGVDLKQWTIFSTLKYDSTVETLICSRFGTMSH